MSNRNKMRMIAFINYIEEHNIMTLFIKNLFDYQELYDYNYLFRLKVIGSNVIIDIYDNVSNNRFNRYIFNFNDEKDNYHSVNSDNVYVTYLNVLRTCDSENKLDKLAHLFSLKKREMYDYAKTFLDDIFINILRKIK